MQIIRDGEVVAAVLLHMADKRLAYVWVGVPESIQGDMFNGAFSALYYYTILYGYENGCREIDFLGTRPILNDGLFRYKRKWGTCIRISPVPRGDMLLKPLHLSIPVKSFFTNNFFITKDPRKNNFHILGARIWVRFA
jgi:lipid II:glycine glycyltransferase (peptidoglycan interpeptide bridge formation enzyme)